MQFDHQGEIQYAFFHRQSITLHPVVCYYKCNCGQTVRDEIMCFTDDQRHNHIAVRMFLRKVLELVKKQTQVKKIIQWSDNCAGQYKSHKAFTDISKSTIPTECHFFGAQHGKGPADAFIGQLKQWIHMAIFTSKVDIE